MTLMFLACWLAEDNAKEANSNATEASYKA